MRRPQPVERPNPYPEFALADQALPAMLSSPTVSPRYLADFVYLDTLATEFQEIGDRTQHNASAHRAFLVFLANRAECADPPVRTDG